MARPLPRALQELSFSSAHQFRYVFYLNAPLKVDSDGNVQEATPEDKASFFERAIATWNRARKHVEPLIEAAALRLDAQAQALSDQGAEARCVTYATATRLLAGLGYQNGVEVGLSLHPLYGFPYLPGSSVKGVVRAWAEKQQTDAKTMTRLFGSASKLTEGNEEEHQQGAVRFFDALPAAWPRLEVDVMTPHFGPYYQNPVTDDPAVWHDPVPVAFLAVAPDIPFRFLIATRSGAYGARPGDLDKVVTWLGEALAWLGAGGKTSTGYGRFNTDAFDSLFS